MSDEKHCAACDSVLNMNDKDAFKTCMHGGRHYYVCNSHCMYEFYNPKPKHVVADLAQIQGEVRIVNAARAAHSAWLAHNANRIAPDLGNAITARQLSTEFAHAMLALGLALEGK